MASKSSYVKTFASIPVTKINRVTNYSRVDVESCQDLAESIQKRTQLHPIGVTPSEGGKFDLVYGYRRYTAVADVLKQKTIEANILLNKDESPLTDMQKAELNAMENATHKHPALLEIGPAVVDMINEGKGLTTVARVFAISTRDCGRVYTTWKIIPQKIIDQVIPHKGNSEPGLSFAHLHKLASTHKSSKKLNQPQILEACNFVLNHPEPVTAIDFGKTLQAFILGGSFEDAYTALKNKVGCDHLVALRVNKKRLKNSFKNASIRNIVDTLTQSVKKKDYDTARKVAISLRRVCLLD